MKRRDFLKAAGCSAIGLGLAGRLGAQAAGDKPNIIYMMLDEIGYFELSCMGHKILKTPTFDRIAAQGMRFTQCLAGGPVCGPTRCVLLTGKHMGHCEMRTNGGGTPITRNEFTLGEMFKSAGYATGGFGKWGIGDTGTTGAPELHGFDLFYGYYHQVHAHSYYPEFMVRNGKKEMLEGNTGSYTKGKHFSQQLIHNEAKKFIRKNKDKPFFCYLPYVLPHGLWGMPEDDPSWLMYKDMKLGGKGQRRPSDPNMYAAMIHMADRYMGEIMALLKELKLDDNTIIVFSGDNGGQAYFRDAEHPRGVFEPNSTVFRGGKGSLLEGGLRVPYFVRWPGKIKAKSVSDHLCSFADVMPTLAEVSGAKTPKNIDGISFLPTLLGKGTQKQHDFLYWEYMGQVAVRKGKWKAYMSRKKVWQLFDLDKDTLEENDLAKEHPDILKQMADFAKSAHIPAKGGGWIDSSQKFTRPKRKPRKKARPKK
ncbi:MAG: arylsulfatase [Phycisphaerae bacterium]|jgi:arylsulfatase A-like enzyme|nr:arylsulfatase [Phycisphaerae bacterium]